ncbi:MAG TPA: hypothetical protein VN694_03410 [Caulobacteraceae bacterium]|nr:hypothetical protein [Caulobacteraceae bacterium]
MSHRRMAADAAQLAEGDPTPCFCGGKAYDYSFTRFPMTHVSRCRNCGFEHRCELKVTPAKPPPAPASPEDPPIGLPPFWY